MPKGRSTARPPAGQELARRYAAKIPPISQWPKPKHVCDHCHQRTHPAEYPQGNGELWCVECASAKTEGGEE